MSAGYVLPVDHPRHGTVTGYVYYRCRCMACTTAAAVARKAQRKKGLAPGDSRHGRYSTYCNWACRCMPCTNAMRLYYRNRRAA